MLDHSPPRVTSPTRCLRGKSLGAILVVLLVCACQVGSPTPTPVVTLTAGVTTPLPTPTTALPPADTKLYRTYAHGELLPDMRVPILRAESGEGGWYTLVATQEGWEQFLSQMGQPEEIWEPITWGQEILLGALLGVRSGRGHGIAIEDVQVDGITVRAEISTQSPAPQEQPSSWIAYPFHFVRVPRDELPLGPMLLEFVAGKNGPATAGQLLVSDSVDITDLDILWLPGEQPTHPTPTPPPSTSTPEPTLTATPVPHLQSIGTVLAVDLDMLRLRLLLADGSQHAVDLMEATSILLEDDRPGTIAQILPGMTISVLGYEGEGGTTRAAHLDILPQPTDTAGFAPYHARDVSFSTLYDGYALPLAAQRISTTVALTQTLNPTQTAVLTQTGFVVAPGPFQSFAELYGDPQGLRYPAFISADAVLHLSESALGQVSRSVERDYLLPEMRMLDREMYEVSMSQYESIGAPSSPAEQRMATTALRNAAYFAVPMSLLDPTFTAPDVISPVVSAELALISASQEITVSPLLDIPGLRAEERQRIDYSGFVPPGRYALDEELARYHQALTWHRAIALRPSQREETRSAVLMAYAMSTRSAARVLWDRVHDTLAFLHGQDASFTPAEYAELIPLVWGDEVEITSFADEEALDAFATAVQGLPLPDNPIWTLREREGSLVRQWHFVRPTFRLDDHVFERTTYTYVGSPSDPRVLPSYVDLSAALGSFESYLVAAEMGENRYSNYVDQLDNVRSELSTLQPGHWTADLPGNWLYAYRALIADKTLSYPEWMRTAPWQRRELQTMYGSWTTVQHDGGTVTATSTLESSSAEEPPAAPWGYVEPQPQVYGRLNALTRMLGEGLDRRLMLTTANRTLLTELETWLGLLQDIARRELTGQTLDASEYQRLGEFSSLLRGLAPAKDEAVTVRITEAEKAHLVEATGRVNEIYVIVERDREQYLARGGVYGHYEFTWPAIEPLTDAQWREQLDIGAAPERPVWVHRFIVE